MRGLLLVAWIIPLTASGVSWNTLRIGDQCVSTSAFEVIDAGRVAPSVHPAAPVQPRRIKARIWYPDPGCRGEPVRFWSYWGESESAARANLLARIRVLGGDEAAALHAADAALRTPMLARPGNTRRSSQGRIVLIPGEAGEQGPLAESLASHGFVVVVVPYQGTFIPDYAAGSVDLETQAQDMQRVLGELQTDGLGLASRAGLVCHAISSTACAMLAMRDPRIAALASWEGGLPSGFEQDLLRRSPYFEVAALRAPLLVAHAPHPNIDPKLLDPYRFASQLRVQLPHTSEHHLLVYGLLEDLAPGLLKKKVQRTADALAVAADVLTTFLRAELGGDAEARAALASRPDGSEAVVGDWVQIPGSDARVATVDLQRRLHAEGVPGVRKYCREVGCSQLVDPETFRRLAGWISYQEPPLRNQRLDFAMLRTEIFPQSARARVALAFLARELGDKAMLERERPVALELLRNDPDPSLDAVTRENLRKQLEEPAV